MKKIFLFLFLPLYVQAGAVETNGTFNRAEKTFCPDMTELTQQSGSFMQPQSKAPGTAEDILLTYSFEGESYLNCGEAVSMSVSWTVLENAIKQKLSQQGYSVGNLLDEYDIDGSGNITQFTCTTEGGNNVFLEDEDPLGVVECTRGTNNKPNTLTWYLSDGSNLGTIYQYAAPQDGLGTNDFTTYIHFVGKSGSKPSIYVALTIPAESLHFATGSLDLNKVYAYWFQLYSNSSCSSSEDAREVRMNVPVASSSYNTVSVGTFSYNADNLLESTEFVKNLHDYFRAGEVGFNLDDAEHFPSFANVSPHFEFTLPSWMTGNSFNMNAYNGIWYVRGASGNRYELSLSNDRKRIVNGITTIVELDDLGAIRFVEGPTADDILNYCGHNELGDGETFTAYIKIAVDGTCYPVCEGEDWFNVRFLRPLDLKGGNEIKMPTDSNEGNIVNLSSLVTVKDWRGYTGDPNNKAGTYNYGTFNFNYYQIGLGTALSSITTDAHLSKKQRNDNSNAFLSSNGRMYNVDCDYWGNIDGIQIEYESNNALRITTNVECTGEWHLFVPVILYYVFGSGYQSAYTMLTFKNDEPTNVEVGESNRSMFVNCNNGMVVVDGLPDGRQMDVYTTAGVHVGSCQATGGKAHVKAPLPTGTMIIVKAGNKTWKTIMR